jgi:HD-like signal output (HDOD) protein
MAVSLAQLDSVELTVDDLLQGDVTLVSAPETYARLRRLLQQPNSTTAELAGVIEHDPGMAARILRLANSAFFGVPYKVNSISNAVKLLGMREIEHLVLATEVVQRFRSIPQDLVNIYSFWHESVRCAVLARLFACQRIPRGDVDSVFSGALLCGTGHLIIYTRIPELGRKALLESRHRGQPLHEAERSVMGFHYAEVGAALAANWQLPEALRIVIANHIHPQQTERYREESALVALALAASRARCFDGERVKTAMPREPALWEMARLSPESVEQALPEAERAFMAALAFFR